MDIILMITIDFIILIILGVVLWFNTGSHIDKVRQEILEEIRKNKP